MKSSLAPNAPKALMAFTMLLAAGRSTAADSSAPVDTDSEAYKKAYEKACADEKAGQAAAAPKPEVAPVAKSDSKQDATTDAGKDGKVADVTVTAKKEAPVSGPYVAGTQSFKRPAPLLETPQQITVVSQQVLQDRHAVDLKDALKNSPGITYNAGEGGNSGGDNFNMRGFNIQSDVFIDGVRDTALYNRDMFATEQVEIVKGPAGAYQAVSYTHLTLPTTSRV